MRPLRLEVEGFTAFRDRQEVDFADLDLFVITGPTGAGKTSLLDAMALALYGEVPRMGRRGLGQLVSHGRPEARILLEFSAAGDVYRVSRRLPRNGAQQGRLERREGDEWVDAVERGGVRALDDTIRGLVCLDFESFCKAVVLPQGEFARFLKGDRTERRRTLVALLGLGHFERMSALARERARELRIRGEHTQSILAEQFADATAEGLEQARAQARAAAGAAARMAQALGGARELDAGRERDQQVATLAGDLAARCVALAADLRAEHDACRDAERGLATASDERRGALGAVDEAEAASGAATARVDETVAEVGTAAQLALLVDAAGRRVELERRVVEAADQVGAVAARERERSDDVDAAQAAADAARGAEVLARAAADDARAESERLAGERDAAATRLRTARAAAQAASRARADLATVREDLARSQAAAAAARAAEGDAQQAHEDLRRSHAVAGLVAGLAAGDPCPVCERPFAEHPVRDVDVGERLAAAASRESAARAAAQGAGRAEALAGARAESVADRLDAALEALAEALGDRPDIDALEAAATTAGEGAEAAQAAHAEASARLEAASEALNAALVECAAARERLSAVAQERGVRLEAAQHAAADRDQALALLRDRFGPQVPADAAARLDADRARLSEAETAVTAARAREAAARRSLAAADERERAAAKAIAAVDLRLQERRADVHAVCARSADLHGEAPLEDVPGRDVGAAGLGAWCDGAATALRRAGERRAATAAATAAAMLALAREHKVAADAPPQALAGLEGAERAAADSRVRAEEAARNLARRVDQRVALERQAAAERADMDVLDVLAIELRADHFTDFVVQETFDVLAVSASEELRRVSDGRYSLVADGGDFEVVDHVNADERRSVKTLSGGETFMASLSLALALSKHVTDLAGEGLGARLEAVFIDEGFGSLDPETLEEVIDALERLREDDLLVGVISHVATLAERIRAGLEVRKDGNRSVVVQVA